MDVEYQRRVSRNVPPTEGEDDDDGDDDEDDDDDDDDDEDADGSELNRQKRDTNPLQFADDDCKSLPNGVKTSRVTKNQKNVFLGKHNNYRKEFIQRTEGGVCGMWKVVRGHCSQTAS